MSRSDSGVTLVEMLVALSVIAVALTALTTVFGTTAIMARASEEQEMARNAAQQKIAEVRQLNADNLAAFTSQEFDVCDLPSVNSESKTGSIMITEGPDGPEGARLVTVVVTWRTATGDGVATVRFQSLVGRDLASQEN